jgi:hypothetical protein
MTPRDRTRNLDLLLTLDGEDMVIGDGPYWVKIIAKRVPVSPERPHGLYYSLTLHDEDGSRVLGYDNAHPVREGSGPGARKRAEHDHRHRMQSVRSYEYQDAETLIVDFWTEVEALLREKGTSL